MRTTKRHRELVKLCKDAGAKRITITQTRKHLRIEFDDDAGKRRTTFASLTPSDGRGDKNIKRDIAAMVTGK